jgi:hypothetical protein
MDQPPVIPPKIPQLRPPPVLTKQKRSPLVTIVLLLAIAFGGFLVFRMVQFGLYLREHPMQAAPGQTEFREADRQIIANKGAVAFGNSSEAIALAKDYSASIKILRENLFTKGNKDAFSMSKGEFLTYCQLTTNACVFLVHVPELRHFTGDAKQTMVDLAWVNAQSVLKAKLRSPPKTVVVGVKGAFLYDGILIGDFVLEPSRGNDGIKTRSDGATLQGMRVLYPFFASPEEHNEPK